jgi:hypothetical protein
MDRTSQSYAHAVAAQTHVKEYLSVNSKVEVQSVTVVLMGADYGIQVCLKKPANKLPLEIGGVKIKYVTARQLQNLMPKANPQRKRI